MITQENIPYTTDEIKAMVKTCEKYNKALERASKLRVQNPFDTVGQMVEYIFPELAESEDERIRKELIEQVAFIPPNQDELNSELDTLPCYNERIERYRSWLEKQGEQPTDKIEQNPAWSEEDGEMLTWLCRIIHTQRLDRAITLKEESELGEWIDKWLNYNPQTKQGRKQGKSALSAWKDMRLEVYQQASGNRHEPNYSDGSTKMFSLNDIDEIIEKISEQCKATN